MNGYSYTLEVRAGILIAITSAMLTIGHGSRADGLPTSATTKNWSGAFAGGHVGYAGGRSAWTAASPGAVGGGSIDLFEPYDPFSGRGSYFIGGQAGYNARVSPSIVVGFEADFVAPNTIAGTQLLSPSATGQVAYEEKVMMSGTLRGRLGYLHNNWLLYGTAGYAWSYDWFTRAQVAGAPTSGTARPGDEERGKAWRQGWTAGAGVEVPVGANWTASAQYLFTAFGGASVAFPAGAQIFESDLGIHSLRAGLNYQFGGRATDQDSTSVTPKSDRWAIHAQTTYVQQYAFPFRSPSVGTNSFIPDQTRQTWDATFYAGFRLWPGAELWFNPEIDQGFGLSGTVGIAGFVSGEAYKLGASHPYARLPRTFLRQTINLGGETQAIESGPNQFSGTHTASRVVLTIGKFSVTDIFDNNKFAHDPRSDFLNWALLDTGSFDYAADAWGFTYGLAAEWYQGPWAFRLGLFDLSVVPNSTHLDPTFEQHQWIAEIERRYTIGGQDGRVALTGFLTQGRMGRLEEAIRIANQTGNPADIASVRRFQSRTGVSVNLEQQLSPAIGFFARAGLSDGRFEAYEFTDIDRTIAVGLAFSGKLWGRSDDTIGLAGVVNVISREREAFLDAGGLGILVGDGRLPSPGAETIIETYYSYALSPATRLTVDYQLISNPGYNEGRGPVSVIGTRLRAQF